jgi:hypothetical protein
VKGETTIESKAKEKANSLLQRTMNSIQTTRPSNSTVMNFVMESEGEAQRLTSMLSRFRETTPSQPLVEDITDDEPITRSSSSKYSSALPTVRRAADRILTCDSLAQLHAITAPPPPTPPPPLQLLNPIKLNTRLNGKHRGNWKMSKSDNFLKVIFLISVSLSLSLSLLTSLCVSLSVS